MAITVAGRSEYSVNRRTTALLLAATATNGVPTLVTQGVAMPHAEPVDNEIGAIGIGFRGRPPEDASILVKSTAGSGTMTVVVRLWGWNNAAAAWFPLGAGTDADKGKINASSFTMGETSPDVIRHAEPVQFVGHFDRLYAEIVSIAGTSTAVDVYIVVERTEAF